MEMRTNPSLIESVTEQFVFSMRVYNKLYLGKPLDLDVLAETETDASRVTVEFLESVIGSTFGDEADVSCYSSSIEPWKHIESVTESFYGATNEYYSIHLTRSAETRHVQTLCGRRVRGTGAAVSVDSGFVSCRACKSAARTVVAIDDDSVDFDHLEPSS